MREPVKPLSVGADTYWVGALNPDLRRFDVVMETEYGTSYNSYIICGKNKTALIDTVKDGFLFKSKTLIEKITDISKLDYIILQHTEPDHSGSLAELIKLAPMAKIVCSKPASLYLPHITNMDLDIQVVKDGDTIDLGGHVLQFISAPFLHWPDTMFTYDNNSGCLFTCDAFGCHYAAENILESNTEERFKGARRYYYDCLVAPFAPHVLKAISHVNELNLTPINTILPSHGPVLDKDPLAAVALYYEWAREQAPLTGRHVFIGYVSCYGYTKMMAQHLSESLQTIGAAVDIVDFVTLTPDEAVKRMIKADAIAIGSPTLNADALPPIWAALSLLPVPVIRGRIAAAFGSFGWSGEAVPMIEQRLGSLGLKIAGSVKARFLPDAADLDEVSALGDKIASHLKL